LIPIGVGTSVRNEVAECQRILQKSGLVYEMHANGTNVEGEWDDIMRVIKECQESIHAMGCPRISTSIKIGTRTDKPMQSMRDKVVAVESLVGKKAE
ncbi:hypothetical protein DFJ73DRAFT_624628, partial [Zopfochytrium polystomum]